MSTKTKPKRTPPRLRWSRQDDLHIGGIPAEVWTAGPWTVLRTIDTTAENAALVHVSISHRDPEVWPTWLQLVAIRDRFIGENVDAVQKIPPKSEWISLRDNCFHVFARLDGGRALCEHWEPIP